MFPTKKVNQWLSVVINLVDIYDRSCICSLFVVRGAFADACTCQAAVPSLFVHKSEGWMMWRVKSYWSCLFWLVLVCLPSTMVAMLFSWNNRRETLSLPLCPNNTQFHLNWIAAFQIRQKKTKWKCCFSQLLQQQEPHMIHVIWRSLWITLSG